jgi:hypothetical protein
MGDNFPSRLVGEALSDRGQILVGHLFVIEGSLIKERAEGILTPEAKILKEALCRDQLILGEPIDQDVKDLSLFHVPILHDSELLQFPRPGGHMGCLTASHGPPLRKQGRSRGQSRIRAGAYSRALAAIIPLGADGTLAILPRLKDTEPNPTVHVILDISGYFE